MKQEQFTKGKWAVSPYGYVEVASVYNPKMNLIVCSLQYDEHTKFDNWTANANLLAAAPDMYEALKHSRGVISTLLVMVKMDNDEKIICHEALLKINESLSKANPQPTE